jgi:NAD(P)-dependent dehydrogenase (short-subunit alcohol dehydrogenase family)
VRTLVADVTDEAQVRRAVEGTAAEAGRCNNLINHAGIGRTTPFEADTVRDWEAILGATPWSVIHGVWVAGTMIPGGGGSCHIVNTSSIDGPHARAHAITNTTKPAVTRLTKSLRNDHAGTGIVSFAASPACVATAIFGRSLDGRSSPDQKVPESVYPSDRATSKLLDRFRNGGDHRRTRDAVYRSLEGLCPR